MLAGVLFLCLATSFKSDNSTEEKDLPDFNYDFSIKDLNDHKIPFSEFKGKVIFLNIWATWCGPCRAEMQSIQGLYNQVDHQRIAFVMLSIDDDNSKKKVVDYIQKRNFTFTAYQPSGYLPSLLQVPEIPTTFIISPEGKVVRKEIGGMNYDTAKFRKYLESLLN